MSRKIFYAAFAMMGFRLGVYTVVAWIEAFSLIWPYLLFKDAPWYVNVAWPLLVYPPLILAVIMIIFGFFCGCKYVAGWSWWDVFVMLAIGAAGAVFPVAIISWQTKMLWLFWK